MADIKYIPTWAGRMYLAVVLDVFSRRAVGWSLRDHLPAELMLEALEIAVNRRRLHGDLVQLRSWLAVHESLLRAPPGGVWDRAVDGIVGDAYDNALAESFFATFETELLWTTRLRNKTEARRRDLRFHRRLLQHAQDPLADRHVVTGRV